MSFSISFLKLPTKPLRAWVTVFGLKTELCQIWGPSARVTKKKRKRENPNKIRNDKGTEQPIPQKYINTIKEYDGHLYANKFNNLEEMDKPLETYSPPKLNKQEIDHLNRPITRGRI